MIVGTDRVSNEQMDLLRMAKRASRSAEFNFAFQRIAADTDIRSEKESVHPDWIVLFQERESLLKELDNYEQISEFFSSLRPFDEAVAQLDPRGRRVTFLLGAGASKPDPSNIPTVRELLPQLLERARRLDRDDVTRLADFCEDHKIDNIEDLLTAAQLATFSSRTPTVLRLTEYLLYGGEPEDSQTAGFIGTRQAERMTYRERSRLASRPVADLSSVAFLQDTLQVLFGLLSSTMLPAKPNTAHNAIATFVRQQPGSSIITTNYDCCMDLALGDMNGDLDYRIEFTNVKEVRAEGDCTQLIKLHGSLNWFYCETCQEVQLTDIRRMVSSFLEDKVPYPVIGICKDCGGQRRGLLVPPLAMKFDMAPPLTPLLTYAKEAFDNADLIVVVGFSFAEADVYISRMLSKSIQTSPEQMLVIMDPDYRLCDRVRRKFTASIPNFDSARVIRIAGDCSEILPGFLAGQLLKDKSASGSVDTGASKPRSRKRYRKPG